MIYLAKPFNFEIFSLAAEFIDLTHLLIEFVKWQLFFLESWSKYRSSIWVWTHLILNEWTFIELEDFLFRWSNLRNDWLRVRICKIDSQKEWKVAPLIYRIICICPINTSLWVSADQSQLCFVKRNIRPHCRHLSFFEGMLHQWQADRSNYRRFGRIQFKSKVFW